MVDISEEVAISEPGLLKEEVINDLDTAVRRHNDGEIDSLELYAEAVNVWRKANKNKTIRARIKEGIKKRRMVVHQMAAIDIPEGGDPLRQRYDPNHWMGSIPDEFRGREEEFILERIGSLREFFEHI